MTEDDLPRFHHDFMVCYGWIPIKEFKKIPIHTLLTLHKFIQDDIKAENEYKKAVLKGLGYKIK